MQGILASWGSSSVPRERCPCPASRWTEAEGPSPGAEALTARELPTWVRYFDATRGRQWLLSCRTGIMDPGPVPSS